MCGLDSAPAPCKSVMRIGIVTPAPPGSRFGNRVTALRWARILRKLGHRVSIRQKYKDEPLDLLIALHARRSFTSVQRFHEKNPTSPIIVALTGTDLYRDIGKNEQARASLDLATRLIVLQAKAFEALPRRTREKARVIFQSVELQKPRSVRAEAGRRSTFDVCVIGHLRSIKDPFRAALAARLLPRESRVRILQVGGAMSETMAKRARKEMRINPRYHWVGERPRRRVLEMLRHCNLCVLSSKIEGGANALSEAIVASVPVLASRIPGSMGILGEDCPGYFAAGNAHELAELLRRAETDAHFLRDLRRRGRKLAPLFNPKREQRAWAALMDELFQQNGSSPE